MEGFYLFCRRLDRVRNFHFKIHLKSVFYHSKVLFQGFKPIVIKLEIWPKPKRSILTRQKQIAPTVLSKPWDCLQYCWSRIMFFDEVEFAWLFLLHCPAFSNLTASKTQLLFLSNGAPLSPQVCNVIHRCSCTILTISDTQNLTHQRLMMTKSHCLSSWSSGCYGAQTS